VISKEDVRALGGAVHEVAVSIYMPTHEAGAATRENPIRFKNRLQEAEELLTERGYKNNQLDELLAPARSLVDDYGFWQHQREGLVVFASEEGLLHYLLPFPPEELTVVSDRFHLKPLLPLLTEDGRFFILAMSLKSARLFEATRYSVSEVPLEGVPTSLEEALRYDDDPEPTLRGYATTGPRRMGGTGAAPLQAQGAEEEDRKEDVLRFFKLFDNHLCRLLEPQGDRIPVVFAGDRGMFPIYREANQYNGLVEEFIEGNPEHVDVETLHGRAWEIVEPHFTARRERDREAFLQAQGKGGVGTDLEEVLLAAVDSRVETLFVPLHARQWGSFDPEARTVERVGEEGVDTHDLYDLAAVNTLLMGGTVYAVDPEEVPGGGEVAAIYRF